MTDPQLGDEFWEQINGPQVGWILCLATNSNGDIFAGTNTTGIFRSTDNGNSWKQVNMGLSNLHVKALAITQDEHIYAGTYSGLFRSEDNGESWGELDIGISDPFVKHLLVIPNGHIYLSTYEDVIPTLFRSTDKGDTWSQIHTGFEEDLFTSIKTNSWGHIFIGSYKNGILRSTDGGEHWLQVYDSSTHINSLTTDANDRIFAGSYGKIIRSTDNGDSWTESDAGIPLFSNIRTLAVTSTGQIFAGIPSYGVFRSLDGGDSWIKKDRGLTDTYITSIFADNMGRIFAGTKDGGIFYSQNNGESWAQVNRSGITESYISSIAINSEGHIFAGAGGCGGIFRSTDNGKGWQKIVIGDKDYGVQSLVINPDGYIFAIAIYCILDDYPDNVGIYRSTDNGDTWSFQKYGCRGLAINRKGHIFSAVNNRICRSTDNGESFHEIEICRKWGAITALTIDSNGHIFAGTWLEGVFRSTDNGDTWSSVNEGLPYPEPAPPYYPLEYWYRIRFYCLESNSKGRVFAGTDKGMYRFNSTVDIWEQMKHSLDNDTDIMCFMITEYDMIFAGSHNGSLFYSHNDGESWNRINTGCIHYHRHGVYCIGIDKNDHVLMGTGGKGLYRSLLPIRKL